MLLAPHLALALMWNTSLNTDLLFTGVSVHSWRKPYARVASYTPSKPR